MKRAPRDWVDEVAIERALRRQRVGRPLTHAERVIAARHIAEHGGRTSAICTRLRVSAAYAAQLLVEATDTREDLTVDQLVPELQQTVAAAQQLVAAVHGMDPARVDRVLAGADLAALCIVLAAGHRADIDMVRAIAWSTNPDEYQRLLTQGVSPEHAAILAAGRAVKAA